MTVQRVLFIACVALLAGCALAADRTLGTVSGPCKDIYQSIISEHYREDAQCATQIEAALSTRPTSPSQCPNGAVADAGSNVQKCLSKSQATRDAWISFIKQCEILNVNERTGAGEAEAAADPMPSCFPRFDSLNSFVSYLNGQGATSGAAQRAVQGALLVAAGVGAAMLL